MIKENFIDKNLFSDVNIFFDEINDSLKIYNNDRLLKKINLNQKKKLKNSNRDESLIRQNNQLYEDLKDINVNKDFFECMICNRIFNRKYNLKRHYLVHTKKYPYKCEKCGKGFIENYVLIKHYEKVHNEKKYKLDFMKNRKHIQFIKKNDNLNLYEF